MKKTILIIIFIRVFTVNILAEDTALSNYNQQVEKIFKRECNAINLGYNNTINCSLNITITPQQIKEDTREVESKLVDEQVSFFDLDDRYNKNKKRILELNKLGKSNSKDIESLHRDNQMIKKKIKDQEQKIKTLKEELNSLRFKNKKMNEILKSMVDEMKNFNVYVHENKRLLELVQEDSTNNKIKIWNLNSTIIAIQKKLNNMDKEIKSLRKDVNWWLDRLYDVNRDAPRIGILKEMHGSTSDINSDVKIFSVSLEGKQVGHSVTFKKFSFSEKPRNYTVEFGLIYFWYESSKYYKPHVFNPYFGMSTGYQFGDERAFISKIFTGIEYKEKFAIEYGKYDLHKSPWAKEPYYSSKFLALKYRWAF